MRRKLIVITNLVLKTIKLTLMLLLVIIHVRERGVVVGGILGGTHRIDEEGNRKLCGETRNYRRGKTEL